MDTKSSQVRLRRLDRRQWTRHTSDDRITATDAVSLPRAKLIALVRENDGVRYLDVRSRIDPEQSLLLPLPASPLIAGVGLITPLSLLCDLPWALAYGSGPLAAGCVIRFESDSLRFRRAVQVTPRRLDEHCWVADVRGVFTTVATVVGGVESCRVLLANRW
jgi:hypothetical protein